MDLNEVLELNVKYLENFILNSYYQCSTLNQLGSECNFDLVISNFAFSELPRALQIKYVEKVLSKSKRGYLVMNSGNDDSVFTKGSHRWKDKPLHIKELEEELDTLLQNINFGIRKSNIEALLNQADIEYSTGNPLWFSNEKGVAEIAKSGTVLIKCWTRP